MPDRRPYVAGNWKMYKTAAETREYIAALPPPPDGVQIGLCVPYTSIHAAIDSLEHSDAAGIGVLAQNMHQEPAGAYTGEVSAPMLVEAGVSGVVLGHSERRMYNGETDRALQAKVPAALDAGLEPILCVGESEEERARGETQRKLRHQVQEALEHVDADRLGDLVIAYEPIWAIGTGQVATSEQAQEAIAFIRALVGDRSRSAAERVRILYGGSVKPDNAREIMQQRDVDGALVGGASLEPESFLEIAAAAR
jgi:triosephosphate isomerase (TIM)